MMVDKKIVAVCKITPSDCGITILGSYLAHIRYCIISNRAVLVLEKLPQFSSILQEHPLEAVCHLLENKIPVIALIETGTTKSGLHWVKSDYRIILMKAIAPEPFISNPIVKWTEETLHGKVIYSADGCPILPYAGQTNVCGIPTIKTVFRSTLEKLVSENKATKEDSVNLVAYTIIDPEIAKIIKEHNVYHGISENENPVIYKHNIPENKLLNTITVPL